MFTAIVQDEGKFDQMFNESLKLSDAITDKDVLFGQDSQERIFNNRQLIFVGTRQFEFTQFDAIFTLSRSPFLD